MEMAVAELFMNPQKRLAYRFCCWIKMKAYQAKNGKTNADQAEMIALRVRLYEQQMVMKGRKY